MFSGSMVALITPMHKDGSIDETAVQRLVDMHVEQGTTAIVAVGTTGESATLNEQEHCHLIELVVTIAAGRIPIIAGTGANSTSEAITLTRCAKKVGATACLLVTPYYNKPTQEGLYQHHKTIAETVDIPQILYNVPGRTACDLLPETVARLAQIPNIIGIKEATGDLSRVPKLRQLCGADFAIYSGDDATAKKLMLLGGQGTISVTANLVPQLMAAMSKAAVAGDKAQADVLDAKLQILHKALFIESNPIPVKWAAFELGWCNAGIRLPLTWLSESAQPIVKTALQQVGLLQDLESIE